MNSVVSVLAEKMVLRCVLIDQTLALRTELRDSDFSDALHRKIFRHVRGRARAGKQVDYVLLQDQYRDEHPEASERLAEIIGTIAALENFPAYEEIVAAKARSRRLIEVAGQIGQIATSEVSIDEQLGQAQKLVLALAKGQAKDTTDIGFLVKKFVDHLDSITHNKDGLMTGLDVVDRRLNGVRRGDLMIVAARPSMGKTTYALNIALAAARAGKKTLVFSLEMPAEQVIAKLASSASSIAISDFMDGSATDNSQLGQVLDEISNLPIAIDDTPALTIHQVAVRARRAAIESPLDLIVLDYIGLVAGETDSRTENVSRISAGLKALARELRVPVIALAQLNRAVEQRENKRPVLSDLRDSGSIEQDADICQFLYRAEYYQPDEPRLKGLCEIITAKFRLGQTGTDTVRFDAQHSRFLNRPHAVYSTLDELLA